MSGKLGLGQVALMSEWNAVLPHLPSIGGWPIHCLLSVFVRIHSVTGDNPGGAGVAQWVEGPTLDFGSGHDLMVYEFEPQPTA